MSNEKNMSERALGEFGFKVDEFGQLKAEGCSVTFYSSCGKWEIDIVLPNGSAVGFDVTAIQGRRRADPDVPPSERAAADDDGGTA